MVSGSRETAAPTLASITEQLAAATSLAASSTALEQPTAGFAAAASLASSTSGNYSIYLINH